MSTAMSSRRSTFEAASSTPMTGGVYGVIALLAGALLMYLGAKLNVVFLLGAGFVFFASSLLYWNMRLWSKVYKNTKVSESYIKRRNFY